MPDFTTIWAVIATLAVVGLIIYHWCNPYPLAQSPNWGYRLYQVPAEKHEVIADAFARVGLTPWRMVRLGDLQRTLMEDGITVIASGDLEGSAIERISKDPRSAAQAFWKYLKDCGVGAKMVEPTEPELIGKLFIVELPQDYGLRTVRFALPRRMMPTPIFL